MTLAKDWKDGVLSIIMRGMSKNFSDQVRYMLLSSIKTAFGFSRLIPQYKGTRTMGFVVCGTYYRDIYLPSHGVRGREPVV